MAEYLRLQRHYNLAKQFTDPRGRALDGSPMVSRSEEIGIGRSNFKFGVLAFPDVKLHSPAKFEICTPEPNVAIRVLLATQPDHLLRFASASKRPAPQRRLLLAMHFIKTIGTALRGAFACVELALTIACDIAYRGLSGVRYLHSNPAQINIPANWPARLPKTTVAFNIMNAR
jgi:hypothetical protein